MSDPKFWGYLFLSGCFWYIILRVIKKIKGAKKNVKKRV